jgi:hypothetical protein
MKLGSHNGEDKKEHEEVRTLMVGPATVPESKHQWNTVKALPLWWRKNMSTRIRGPSTPAIVPRAPPKNRETINPLKSSGCTIRDAHTWLSNNSTRDQKIAELRPILWDSGKKKKPPAAIPADPAEFCVLLSFAFTVSIDGTNVPGMPSGW